MFGFLPISIRLPKPTFFRVEKHIKEDENKKMGGVLSAPPNPPRFRPSMVICGDKPACTLGGKSVLLATKKAPKRRRAVLC